jgi:hypothetical protein
MPRRRRTARRVELDDAQFWELVLGPRTCRGPACTRPGHVDAVPLPVGSPGPDERDVVVAGSTVRVRRCSAFATDADREAAWLAHRDELEADLNDGSRPWAWWRYESGRPDPEHPSMTWLAEHGHLTPAEEGNILAWGRQAVRQWLAETGVDQSPSGGQYIVVAQVIARRRGIAFDVPDRLLERLAR